MAEDKFGWAFIGSGRMAFIAADEITCSEKHELVSVCSRNTGTGNALANRYKARYSRSLEEALSVPGVDGVYIAVPQNVHFEFIKKCLDAGKNVLVEKPFTVNHAEALAAVELAKENKLLLSEAMCMLYNPVMQEALSLCPQLGAIRDISVKYAFATRYLVKLPRLTDVNCAGGALLEIGVYGIELCNSFFEGVPEVTVLDKRMKNDVDITEKLELRYPNGTASLFISLDSFRGFPSAVINAENGRLTLPFFSAPRTYKAVIDGKKKSASRISGRYIYEFDTFAKNVREGKIEDETFPYERMLRTALVTDEIKKKLGLVFPADRSDTNGEQK